VPATMTQTVVYRDGVPATPSDFTSAAPAVRDWATALPAS
jgi:hypothetical protein